MTIIEAIEARHSVRQYMDQPIDVKIIKSLQEEIAACNKKAELHIQLVTDEKEAFNSRMAHYGKFSGVHNYLAVIGKKSSTLLERAGYYGEHLVLLAQTLGLNTCWVELTFGKGAAKAHCVIHPDEKLICIIALGYGKTQGIPHKNKPMEKLCSSFTSAPEWFQNGMKAAVAAPTAVNQQKFFFTWKDNIVKAESRFGVNPQLDLGIVKYHFEIGAGKENFKWD